MINQQQALDFGTKIIAIAGGFAVGKGWITSDQVPLIAGLVAAAVPLIYSIIANTQKAQVNAVVANKDSPVVQTALVKAVASYPGLDPLQPNANASPAVLALAADSNVPKVLPLKS